MKRFEHIVKRRTKQWMCRLCWWLTLHTSFLLIQLAGMTVTLTFLSKIAMNESDGPAR